MNIMLGTNNVRTKNTEMGGDKIKMVIIDDNYQFRKILRDYLLLTDTTLILIGTASNGEEGIQKIKELKPDLVLINLIMPKIDGLGVLEAIQQMPKKDRPISILMEVVLTNEVILKAHELGVHKIIDVIEDLDCLIATIKNTYNIYK